MSGPARPLRAAVFDYGGVLTFPVSSMRPSSVATVDRSELRRVLAVVMGYADRNSGWARLERGEITLAEFGEMVDAMLPGASAMFSADSTNAPVARLVAREDMTDRVARIRRSGVQTALCTNNVAEYRPIWSAKFDLPLLFDHIVDSSAVGMRKPEPSMYQHVLSLLGTHAEETLFVDDMAANTEAAAALGFQTILVGDGDEHFAELDELFPV